VLGQSKRFSHLKKNKRQFADVRQLFLAAAFSQKNTICKEAYHLRFSPETKL
jgi:hypothetical protein